MKNEVFDNYIDQNNIITDRIGILIHKFSNESSRINFINNQIKGKSKTNPKKQITEE
jgi:hypothetical protein